MLLAIREIQTRTTGKQSHTAATDTTEGQEANVQRCWEISIVAVRHSTEVSQKLKMKVPG